MNNEDLTLMRITSTLLPFLIAAMMGLSLALSCHAQDFVAQHSKDGADELFSWVASYGLSFGGPDAVTNQYNPY
ncbi:MAG: fructose-specific phosphotransferase system IIC component, partial [Pseudohongiellaceae bacterium]